MSLPIQSSENSYEELAREIREQGRQRIVGGYKRIVFTNGCFDVLHMGHLQTLRFAKDAAGPYGALVVGINDDASIRRLKGEGRPIFDAQSRGMMLVSLKFVDHVIVFEEDTPFQVIRALRPDLIVKGGDYTPNKVVGADLAMVSIAPYDPQWSSTDIIKKIKDS